MTTWLTLIARSLNVYMTPIWRVERIISSCFGQNTADVLDALRVVVIRRLAHIRESFNQIVANLNLVNVSASEQNIQETDRAQNNLEILHYTEHRWLGSSNV